MKVSIVGLDLFGRSLALELARNGVEVIAMDRELERCEAVRGDVSLAVKLDPTVERELRAQGVHESDVLIANLALDFESNLLLVALAKELGVRRIIARAPSPAHARILQKVGADEVLMPEVEAAAQAARALLKLKG